MKNDEIMNKIIEIFYEHSKLYGYRRIMLELKRQGYKVNHKKVQRLMKIMVFTLKSLELNISHIKVTIIINTVINY